MSLSSGSRTLIGEALSWAAAAGILAVCLTHFTELKSITANAVGLELNAPAAKSPPQSERKGRREVHIRAGAHGHFYAEATINGRAIDVLVDTGASIVALTHEDAIRAGIRLRPSDYTGRVSTANGTARVARVRLDRIEIGDITVRDVDATVSEKGALKTTLLGMSFLSRLQRVDMRRGLLVLAE